MSDYYKEGLNRKQQLLLPPSLDDYVDETNPVRAVDAYAELLDWSELGFADTRKSSRSDGQKARDAMTIAHGMIATYEDSHPKLAKFLEDNLGDAMTYLAFPKRHHRKIHTTNVLERFNKEVKRRTKVVGAFPCDGSVLRLLVPLAVDTNAKWLDRKYVSWEYLEHDVDVEEEFTEKF